ncbi:type I phosphomannose isomerase catalytic subunit [Hallella sp.]|uniref:type I phosphomannose isomerase catalytic subunit n=1 Tax=Hallella TaxID=52228 RepID=UPI00284BC88C|nr:type I phosphomannose isomerase catalytic subunit [Hallella sp.]MBS7400307.1 class I mannose-6-phosphate isomerase [Prevotella sp.]MCI7433835.1 class I mannose-6-phosphate isomerase [Prevotella sp.]MDR3845436.1 class I mannose-6-phosphate isomerase [Hallella sp.]MDR4001312.1 class I mannose-6-phosphate isomerase [Hallella sp.]MDY5926288.1 type I phosphomannose isomerase catalytic subunit [Hallella sp.]
MKPYKFEPYLKTTLWGGYQIAPFKGIFTAQPNIGESWEISGVPGHESVAIDRGLVDDIDMGLTLTQLIDKYKGLLVGNKVYKHFGNKFPLLVKFIDSRQDLSVQVHPNDELAMERHGCAGKTEMWYVIKSDVGAKIYSGLRKSITPDDYERLVSADNEENGENPMASVIATHEAHDGDLYFLPAGRLHAIGAGNFLAEIQETSDITYRVYDFGRKDAHGKPRELHIQEARDAIDYQVWPEYRSSYDSTKPISQLINCPHFIVHRVVVQVASQVDFKTDSFVVVMCLWGEANINGVHIHQGETILVPACENVLYIFGNASFLTATL